MKIKLIYPPKLIKTFSVLRELGYGEGKEFCCKNIELSDFNPTPLQKILKEKFNGNYFSFGRWYLKNLELTTSEEEYLTNTYNKMLQSKKNILDDFLSKQSWFADSFKKIILSEAKEELPIFFNLLDFNSHAFNWPYEDGYILSVAYKKEDEFNWGSLRHEILHVILKENSDFVVDDSIIKKCAPKGYEGDEDRVILDEIMVLTMCVLFLENEEKIGKLLNFYDTVGYGIVRNAYEILKEFKLPLVLNKQFQEEWFLKIKERLNPDRV